MTPLARRIVAASAITGALLLTIGTILHPSNADPNDPSAAFAEYAADRLWVVSHLLQLSGVFLIVVSLVSLSRTLSAGRGADLAQLGTVVGGVSLSVAAALQAVDGIALKRMVDAWTAAADPEKGMLFQSAIAVRQVEVGLASILSLLFGIAAIVYGAALMLDGRAPQWLTWMSFLGGITIVGAGVAFAYSGFSSAGMTASMFGSVLLVIWIILTGIWMLRRA